MTALDPGPRLGVDAAHRRERLDVVVWLALVAAGLALSAIAVAFSARLGTQAAPFLGRYQIALSPTAVIAPLVAIAVLWTAGRRAAVRWSWRTLLWSSYLAAFAWSLGLALMRGPGGLTDYLSNQDGYSPRTENIETFGALIDTLTNADSPHSTSMDGHPPGTILVWWAAHALPLPQAWVGVLWTAVAAAAVPLVLSVARSSCGPVAARRFAPLLILAPFAIWTAVGPDGITVTVAAAALFAADYASRPRRGGWAATGWAIVAGILLAAATMFAYIVAWLGLSMVCLYFARRRPGHNLASGLGALLPLGMAQLLGFNWAQGLTAAYDNYLSRIDVDRSLWWWLVLCPVVLLLACGPSIVSSARKLRNTPAWPFLVGGAAAVLFSMAVGVARGGVEETWLPFFPWLIIAATAPARAAGPPLPAPRLLAAVAAVSGLVIQAVLVSPW